jgi:type I restriction enzyme S subunit
MSEEATLDEFSDKERTSSNLNLGPIDIEIPSQWGSAEVSELFELISGNNYTGENLSEEDNGGRIFLTLKSVNKGGGFNQDSVKYYTGEVNQREIVDTGELLIANTDVTQDGDVVGYSIRVPEFDSEREVAASMDLSILRAKTENINLPYIEYLLQTEYIHSRMRAFSAGSTVLHLNTDLVESLSLPLPPLPEQRKIATVLYTVDRAIEKTEEIIGQLESVRQGTEQDLLSRGVLENGSLREEDSIEYKNSWVEEIPKDWKVQPYSELITDSSVGIVVKPSQYYDEAGEVPILRSKDISRDGIVNGDFEYMTQESNEKNANSQLRAGDVITVRSGEPGLSCVVSQEFDRANCADLLISTPGENLNSNYAAMWINSRAGRKQIDRFQAGLAQKHFNLGALRKLRIAVPDIKEQQRIVETVSSITDSIEQEKQYKSRLKCLKRGLMQDLLAGEVRTADRNIEVLAEVEARD